MKFFFTIIVLFANIFFAQQDKFIIGAEHVSSLQEFWGCNLPHSTEFWNNVEEFGLNYVGLKYFQNYLPDIGVFEKSDILSELEVAESRNIKVFLYNGFDHYEGGPTRIDPKRWVYQVENLIENNLNDFNVVPNKNTGFDSLALTHWNLADPQIRHNNFLRLLPNNDAYGLVAKDLREKKLQPDGNTYCLKIGMRLPFAVKYEDVPICTLKVICEIGSEIVDISAVVKANQFSDNNWKEISVLWFIKSTNGPVYYRYENSSEIYNYIDSTGAKQNSNSVQNDNANFTPYDYQIIWNNTPTEYDDYTIDIDYITVDDENAHKLFTGVWDDRIKDAAKDYGTNNAILNIQAHDEVPVSHLYTTRRINKIMKAVLGKGDKNPLSFHYWSPITIYNQLPPTTKRYIWETGVEVLCPFMYPFNFGDNFINYRKFPKGTVFPDDPNPDYYNSYVQQTRFDSVLIPSLADYINTATKFDIPFWFVPQAHKWAVPPNPKDPKDKGQIWQREPSPYEIKAMANLAICYGAKGIIYYFYSCKKGDDKITGLYYYDTNGKRTKDDYGFDKWNVIKDFNHKLALIGDELLSLKWQYKVWSIQNGQPESGYIRNIQSFSNSKPDKQGETYVELSEFKKEGEESDNLEYFFVVNRRTYVDPKTFDVNRSSIFSKSLESLPLSCAWSIYYT